MPDLEAGEVERCYLERSAAGSLTASSVQTSTVGRERVLHPEPSGTPVDQHLNPDPQAVITALDEVADELTRRTIFSLFVRKDFPAVTKMVEPFVDQLG